MGDGRYVNDKVQVFVDLEKGEGLAFLGVVQRTGVKRVGFDFVDKFSKEKPVADFVEKVFAIQSDGEDVLKLRIAFQHGVDVLRKRV